MIRPTLIHLSIGLLCGALPVLAHARMQPIATEGAWTVYAGKADDGRNSCAAQAEGGGRFFSMKYASGDDRLTVHLVNSHWSGRAGLSVDLSAEFDRRGAWTAPARSFTTRDGRIGLHFSIPSAQLDQWVREFERSHQLVVRFPNQREMTDWRVSLEGSERVMIPFAVCMAAVIVG